MNPLGSSLHAETPPAFRWLPIGVHAVSNPALSVPDARKPDGTLGMTALSGRVIVDADSAVNNP
jgi:hypothetical protein